jgi:hypothetical protein
LNIIYGACLQSFIDADAVVGMYGRLERVAFVATKLDLVAEPDRGRLRVARTVTASTPFTACGPRRPCRTAG